MKCTSYCNVRSKRKILLKKFISLTETRGKEWNSRKKNCLGELEPLSGSTYPGGVPPAASVVNKVLSSINKPVYLLDITTLSQLRKDAHPSTYSGEHSGTDCSHWCLPGLPDTRNQLLYAALQCHGSIPHDSFYSLPLLVYLSTE